MKFVQILIFLSIINSLRSELFSAIEELVALTRNEATLIKEYEKLLGSLEEITKVVKRDLMKMEVEHAKMIEDKIAYVSNPLNALLLVKRLSFDAVQLKIKIIDLVETFSTKIEPVRLSREDWEGSVEGLIRLQAFYSLSSQELSKGIIQGVKYRDDLTVNDLFAIGDELMKTERFQSSMTYLSLALRKNREVQEMSESSILEVIYKNSNYTMDKKNQIAQKLQLLSEKEEEQSEIDEKEAQERNTLTREFYLQQRVCTGELKRSDEELSKLYCSYVSNTLFSVIAPFKVEEANINPFIVIYHDVISEKEMEVFRSIAKPNLARAKILRKDATSESDNIRVAKSSWSLDYYHEVFARLTKRVGDMTGLNMKTAEAWQTQNYGIGGHYDAHHDFVLKDAAPLSGGTGNRIATALFYLSDVESGGATVFPYLKIRVQPKKGNALFWYNLSTSGELEYLTRHSACPVLIGNKWVANKWLREYGQEFTRPCELEPAMTDEFYYKKEY